MSWDEASGVVTRAFDEWKTTDAAIRAYLDLSERWIEPAYQSTWDEVEAEFARAFDPDRDDVDGHVHVFHQTVGGLWSRDYFWMLRSGALRDAVTAFEVYAEKSLIEALSRCVVTDEAGTRCRLQLFVPKHYESPSWPTLVAVHGALGNHIEPEEITYVRALRHLLTHQRGELRTEEQRLKFAREADPSDWMVGDAYVGGDVPLAQARLLEMLDEMGDAVRDADQMAWRAAWDSVFPEKRSE